MQWTIEKHITENPSRGSCAGKAAKKRLEMECFLTVCDWCQSNWPSHETPGVSFRALIFQWREAMSPQSARKCLHLGLTKVGGRFSAHFTVVLGGVICINVYANYRMLKKIC